MAVTIFLLPLKKAALKRRLLVSQGVPLVGGLAIGLVFLLIILFGFLLHGGLPSEIGGIMAASFLMLIFGAIDDLRELSVVVKLSAQLIAASFLIFLGVRTQIIHIGGPANIIITLAWILAITNAFNHLDVTDGVAGSTALIAALAFFAVAVLNRDIHTAILSLSLSGALVGFLIFNFPPAKVYMGNSGSHFLGFVLSAVALLISYAPVERKVALISPLLILGFPIFDTAFLVFLRIGKNKLPFKKSNDHLALRFLAAGYSKKKTLFTMACLSLFFSLCGVLLSRLPDMPGIAIIVIIVLLSLGLARKMGRVRVDA